MKTEREETVIMCYRRGWREGRGEIKHGSPGEWQERAERRKERGRKGV